MKCTRILTFISILALSAAASLASAQGASSSGGSEFFHQAKGGTSELNVHGDYSSRTTTAKGTTTDVTLSGPSNLGARYSYGLSDQYSLGADIGYSSLSNNATLSTKSTGLEPIGLLFDGKNQLSNGSLQYGVRADVGLMKGKMKANTGGALTEVSRSGSQFSLTPYVGYEMPVTGGFAGARLEYEIYSSDKKFDYEQEGAGTTPEIAVSGGNHMQLTGFYEYDLSDMVLGGAVAYASVGEQKQKQNGIEYATVKPVSLLPLTFYTKIPVSTSMDFLAHLTYTTKLSADDYDKYSGFDLGAAVRMVF